MATNDGVTAYDNTFDYGGTSGRSYPGLSAQVTYEYTPVPEPTSLIAFWFGGLSLIGLATRRRR